MNSLFIYIGVKPTVFQLLYGSYPLAKVRSDRDNKINIFGIF